MKPKVGKTYKILAVRDPEQNYTVGREVTVDSISNVRFPESSAVVISGRVAGLIGSVDFTEGVVLSDLPVNRCTCSLYQFPHTRSSKCRNQSQ